MDLQYLNQVFTDTKLERNGEFLTVGFLNIKDMRGMMVYIKEEKYLDALYGNPNVSAIITTKAYAKAILDRTGCGVLVADNPERLFYLAHNYLYRNTEFYKKEDYATKIGQNTQISPNAVIAEKNVTIGDDVIIEPGAVILEGVKIGSHCVIGANATIGTRGFQYYRNGDEAFYIEHIGGVVIQDYVEILSGSCVASGFISPTCLCEYAKVDNLVHIGHSAYVDKRVLITAGAVIGGSVYIGKRSWIGINSVICASVHIGDDAFICMGAVVTKDVAEGQKVAGNFAVDHRKQIEFVKSIC